MFKPYKKIIRKLFPAVMMCGCGIFLTGCFDDSDSLSEQYKDWRTRNENYFDSVENTESYTEIIPSWAPNTSVLVRWHNDRSLTQNNLSPMDNSTVAITYELFNIDGKKISDSFANRDSLYISKPSQNIIGVWAALTNMNVGDSVTMVIPSAAGYGESNRTDIPPYSTLVYNIKMKAITAYEMP